MEFTEADGNYKTGWRMASRLLNESEMYELTTSVDDMSLVVNMIALDRTVDMEEVHILRHGMGLLRSAIGHMKIWDGKFGICTGQHILVMKVLKVATAIMMDINILLNYVKDTSVKAFFDRAYYDIDSLSGRFLPNYDNLRPAPSYIQNLPDSLTCGGVFIKLIPPRDCLRGFEP